MCCCSSFVFNVHADVMRSCSRLAAGGGRRRGRCRLRPCDRTRARVWQNGFLATCSLTLAQLLALWHDAGARHARWPRAQRRHVPGMRVSRRVCGAVAHMPTGLASSLPSSGAAGARGGPAQVAKVHAPVLPRRRCARGRCPAAAPAAARVCSPVHGQDAWHGTAWLAGRLAIWSGAGTRISRRCQAGRCWRRTLLLRDVVMCIVSIMLDV